jgi:hypothetical protein
VNGYATIIENFENILAKLNLGESFEAINQANVKLVVSILEKEIAPELSAIGG